MPLYNAEVADELESTLLIAQRRTFAKYHETFDGKTLVNFLLIQFSSKDAEGI